MDEVVVIEDEAAVIEVKVIIRENGGTMIENEVNKAASLNMIEDEVDEAASLDMIKDETDEVSSLELARARYTTRMMPTQGTLQRCMINLWDSKMTRKCYVQWTSAVHIKPGLRTELQSRK